MVTDKQVKKLFKLRSVGMTQCKSADKTDMDVKTARKYLNLKKLPTQINPEHNWRTRLDPFKDVWEEVKDLLENNSGLEGKSIFEYLQGKNPGKYQDGQLRTLQRKIKNWKVTEGSPKEIFFEQVHHPGQLCESDFTDMNELHVTIAGQLFKHKLYHFVLTYSNWETGSICFSESLESLSEGFQSALWELGGVPREHRTDRLSAAINNFNGYEKFTQRYKYILEHYKIKGQRTQANSPHENGDIEQRHYRLKKAIKQSLMIRGSHDFKSREDYEKFIKGIFMQLNSNRKEKLMEEMKKLQPLPNRRIEDYRELKSKVSGGSLITVNHNIYSVHSRLKGEEVTVRLYADHLDIYYGQRLLEQIPRLMGKNNHFIQYRHVIDSLVRKPGAFENYKYRNCMFPSSYFRMAYDLLKAKNPAKANKEYVNILYLAAKENEDLVDKALRMLIDSGKAVTLDEIKKFIQAKSSYDIPTSITIPEVDLSSFDQLLESQVV